MDTEKIVVAIIRNSKGDFFVHQRSKYKKTYPNLFGLGVGGHIKEKETARAAAKRELKEESSLESPIKYLFSIVYQPKNKEKYKVFVFETSTEKDIKTCLEEWQWSGWMNVRDLDLLLKSNKLCPDTAIFYQEYLNKYFN